MKHRPGFRAVRAEYGAPHEYRKPKTSAAMSEMVQDLCAMQSCFLPVRKQQ